MCVTVNIRRNGRIYRAEALDLFDRQELIAFGESFDCEAAVQACVNKARLQKPGVKLTFTNFFYHPKIVE